MNADKNTATEESYPISRFVVVGIVIILATLFWVGFELRSITLNEVAREHLCSNNNYGIPIVFTYLLSINPIFYVILSPVFALFLSQLEKKNREPHPFYFMGSGVTLLGIGLLMFHFFALNTIQGCYNAHWFVLLYIIETFGELLVEPIGLNFINKNTPTTLATLMFVLWECNSGLAYIIGGYTQVDSVGTLGFVIFFGGVAFMLLTPLLRKFVI